MLNTHVDEHGYTEVIPPVLVKDDALIAMQADWTRPNEEIARFLERHERYGIPFNIVFGPGAPRGIALPEVLTPALVLDALSTASARSVARE